MHETKTETAERTDYLRPLRARWWMIVIIALVAAVGTYRYYAGKPVVYVASTDLYMQSNSAANLLGQAANQSVDDPSFLQNQAILLRTEGVAVEAAKLLGYKGPAGALLGYVTASPLQGADFLVVTASAPNAFDAGRIANAFAQAYIATQETSSRQLALQSVQSLQKQIAALPNDASHANQRQQLLSQVSQLQLYQSAPPAPATQVQPAGLGSPIASNPKSHAIYGLALGLLIGAALAYALDALNRRIKRVEDIEPLYGASVIAKIPSAPRTACSADPAEGLQPPIAEAFRALRAALELRSTGLPDGERGVARLRTIMVTSATMGDGKSTVVRNLAMAYVEAGRRVAVVDCDLRRPDLAASLDLDPDPGLPEVLTGTAMTSDALRHVEVGGDEFAMLTRTRTSDSAELLSNLQSRDGRDVLTTYRNDRAVGGEPGLWVMPSSTPSWNPAAIFAGGRFEAVLQGLRAEHDIVILDTSPLAAVSDAAPLLPLVDGVLLVSRIKHTSTNAVADLKAVLAAVPDTEMIGVVANDVRARNPSYAYPYSTPRASGESA